MGQSTSAPKITAQDRALYEMKQQRDKLKQYQKRMNNSIEKQTEMARKAITDKQVEKAKLYLRSKKKQQSMINKTYEQLDNIESLIGTIEFKLIEKDVVFGLKQGNEVLRQLNQEMAVNKVEKLMDDLEEHKLQVDEVSDILGLGSGLTNREELEIDEELEGMERAMGLVDTEAHDETNTDVKMPEVPKEPLWSTADKESDEEQEKETSLQPIEA